MGSERKGAFKQALNRGRDRRGGYRGLTPRHPEAQVAT